MGKDEFGENGGTALERKKSLSPVEVEEIAFSW
jgi:hypothetical protein